FRMSPPRKIRKTEGDQVSPLGGMIRFEVDHVSAMDEFDGGRYSPSVNVGGINWSAKVLKKRDENGIEAISFYLCNMDFKSMFGSIDVRSKFALINHDSTKSFATEVVI
ncbi:hypothetical protein PMAYCL1PPCAC_24840, partial [Pristionchus mayeri]